MKVKLWVIGPFLAYLLVFLLWFPLWQHSPHSFSARVLGILFGAMTAILVIDPADPQHALLSSVLSILN
jgi:hypothetical protein